MKNSVPVCKEQNTKLETEIRHTFAETRYQKNSENTAFWSI